MMLKNRNIVLSLSIILCLLCTYGIYNISKAEEHEQTADSLMQNTHGNEEITDNKHPEEEPAVHNETHSEAGAHNKNAENTEHAEHGDHGGHGGMEPLLFIILALIIGAATRHFLKKSPIPYTVLLLIFGICLGVADRLDWFSEFGSLHIAVNWAGTIDPHLILYVFLPTLIFEAAFAMDVHTFKKSVTNAVLLAVPGIVMALFLTAFLIIGINHFDVGLPAWTWQLALLFGIVISATDPVAVVALLKELGASKKLGTLIEGESLLNDGTAIVIFLVILGGITGASADMGALQEFVYNLHPILKFAYISFGGILLGIVVGMIIIKWVKKVFNDALIEICLIVVAAYITFYIAEGFLYVSGVLALVALGLYVAGIGRTRISPEVEHFLHEFWELAAFIANTLIFIIVGVVIANRTQFTGKDFLILGIIYVGIHVVRAIVVLILFPFMRKAGYGLDRKNATVIWFGALRGAIGLALALIVAGEESIDENVRNEFLFLTAGIVTLTLLVNATTIRFLLQKLGLTKVPPAKALMAFNAKQYLFQSSDNALERLKTDRFLSRANWTNVKKYLPKEPKDDISEMEIETIAETRRRILEKEKSSYWHQFKDGLIGANAVRVLSEGINEVLDAGGMISLAERKDLEELWKTPKLLNRLQSWPLLGRITRRMFFEKLTTSYDCSRGFVEAQEEALKLVESMYRSLDEDDKEEERNLAVIESEINENRIHGLTFLRNLRKNFPEIYNAIATRQAIRTLLNYERNTVDRIQKKGMIENDEAKKMMVSIEARMKKLMDTPPSIELPNPIELLYEFEWLRELDPKTFSRVVELFQNRIYAVGDRLIKEHSHGDGLFVIARGTVKITVGEKVVDILGPGNVIGEMAVLTGTPRIATVTAESPVTALWMTSQHMQQVMQESKYLEEKFWEIAGTRFALNLLGNMEPYNIWREKQFRKWVSGGEIVIAEREQPIDMTGKIGVLLAGEAYQKRKKKASDKGPIILDETYETISADARVYVIPMEEEDTNE